MIDFYLTAEQALLEAKLANGEPDRHPQFTRVMSEVIRMARLGHCQMIVSEYLDDIVIVWLKEAGYTVFEVHTYEPHGSSTWTISGTIPYITKYTVKWASV